MASSKALLDTTILSAIMKGETNVTTRARAYLAERPALTFSIITRYEILRGLKAKGANTQLAAFDQLCANSEVLLLTGEVIVRAADVYATLQARGELIGEADILIGAKAPRKRSSVWISVLLPWMKRGEMDYSLRAAR